MSCIDFSPDGKWIVIGEAFVKAKVYTAKVELLDAVAGQEVRALATHHWEVESVAFSQDGKWLASCNWDRKVRVMEFPSGNQVREFESASKPVCVAISPDSKVIASGGSEPGRDAVGSRGRERNPAPHRADQPHFERRLQPGWPAPGFRQRRRLRAHLECFHGSVPLHSFRPRGRGDVRGL